MFKVIIGGNTGKPQKSQAVLTLIDNAYYVDDPHFDQIRDIPDYSDFSDIFFSIVDEFIAAVKESPAE